MMHKTWYCLEKVPYCFSRSYVKFQGHTAKKSLILTKIRRFWTITPVWFTNGYEMMHNAWSSIGEVPYCFSRSSVKFQGHWGQKSSILTQFGRFRTVTPVWIHQWLWNYTQSLKQHRRGALMFFKVISQISRSHRTEDCRFRPDSRVSGL